ncbi:MAG: hypothetical protein M9927_24370 [Anaerolineae bacterium]|nr:hypothetical protein [Anaerolineae bacterium]
MSVNVKCCLPAELDPWSRPAAKKGFPYPMESITVPVGDTTVGPLAEVTQVSVGADNDVAPVNELLSRGWKLLHIGHAGEQTVYVLGKPPTQAKRQTGFVT